MLYLISTGTNLQKAKKNLSVENINVIGDKGLLAVKNISFELFQNEIFGIAGVSGNGQRELAEAITGIRHISSGKVKMNGRDMTNKSPNKIMTMVFPMYRKKESDLESPRVFSCMIMLF